MVTAKPDCTGERFGYLTVLGKGSKRERIRRDRKTPSYIYLWRLQCDCGEIIELPRGDFDRKKGRAQTSCGCRRKLGLVDNKRRPKDITGERFGSLTAVRLTGYKDKGEKPTWILRCDCGGSREMSYSRILLCKKQNIRLNCGNREKHSDRYLEYPPIPNPYPKEAGYLLEKYLYLSELHYNKIDSELQDEKRDRLLRACWILTYRRQQGEAITEIYEKRFIKKHLRYCSIDVFWKRKLRQNGGLLYTNFGDKKELGDSMTALTYNDYPALEARGKNILLIKGTPKPKKFKFKRV